MNLYTLLALGLVIYIARDLLRVWVETRADATSASALRARVATLEEELETRTTEAEETVEALRSQHEQMITRVEHLETIVTHETWDRMGDTEVPPIDPLPEPDPTSDPSTIAAQWAKRLRP